SSGCSKTHSGADNGRSARRATTAAGRSRETRSVPRRSFVDLEPAPLDCKRDERLDIGGEAVRLERPLELVDDRLERPRAVTAAHDRARAAVELHDALGIQQHVRLLRRLPLQAKAAAEPWLRGRRDAAHVVTP